MRRPGRRDWGNCTGSTVPWWLWRVVLAALNLVASRIGSVTADIASLALLSGLGEGMSIVGSAIMARMAISAAGVGIGKSRSAT